MKLLLSVQIFLLIFINCSNAFDYYSMTAQEKLDYHCGRRTKSGGFLDIAKDPSAFLLPNKQTKGGLKADNYVETNRDADPDFYTEVERDDERYREDYTTAETPRTENPTPTEQQRRIIIILDETGSMIPNKSICIKKFNAFLKKIKKSLIGSKSILTVVKFDYDMWLLNDHLKDFADLNDGTYYPDRNGPTALYDTIGCTLNAYKNETDNLLVIITDGQDNASRLFEQSDIKAMNVLVKNKSKWSFDYFYLGSQDAKEFSKKIGITARHAYEFPKTTKGISKAFSKMSKMIAVNWGKTADKKKHKRRHRHKSNINIFG